MGLKRPTLERSLQLASSDLDKWSKALEDRGITGKGVKRCPKWRHFNARCRQIRRRLLAVDAIAAREAECLKRKAAAEAAVTTPTE